MTGAGGRGPGAGELRRIQSGAQAASLPHRGEA